MDILPGIYGREQRKRRQRWNWRANHVAMRSTIGAMSAKGKWPIEKAEIASTASHSPQSRRTGEQVQPEEIPISYKRAIDVT
jgi:hypothetical protein